MTTQAQALALAQVQKEKQKQNFIAIKKNCYLATLHELLKEQGYTRFSDFVLGKDPQDKKVFLYSKKESKDTLRTLRKLGILEKIISSYSGNDKTSALQFCAQDRILNFATNSEYKIRKEKLQAFVFDYVFNKTQKISQLDNLQLVSYEYDIAKKEKQKQFLKAYEEKLIAIDENEKIKQNAKYKQKAKAKTLLEKQLATIEK